ncbi:MAG TPA: tetratricopeptide repeat protein [Solirubrobacteraceae bacterium]|nr:tetratricopeptide repeat protein [Solirubrobacteraceae bacterium]
MSHELLERLFVARRKTLDAVIARIGAAAKTPERNHTLLVGPRGAGKTHLVSLVYHRVKNDLESGTALQVSWLPEDPWTIVSYGHLLAAIAERLESGDQGDIPQSPAKIEAYLNERAHEGGPIVVIVENLDQILGSLGNEGQQQLRHLLQADRSLLLIATSTRLDRSLSDQASPFYGFFTTTRLEPFSVKEAAAMLTTIAEERGDDDVVAYLATDEGRARLRTITHLAGGQPRIWATLASALTVAGLDELINLLLTRFDDLTPYYQEQLSRLSGQQRLVVAQLAELDHPINVVELADRLGVDQRSLGKTMSELVDRGWASPTTSPVTELLDRRRTYYELAEPLARLSFQIKESRGKPLALIVEFLKSWFDPADLGESEVGEVTAEYLLLASAGHDHDPIIAVTRRLHRLPVTRAPELALLDEIDEALGRLREKDPEPFLQLPTPVRVALEEQLETPGPIFVRVEIHEAALGEVGHTRHSAMESWITRTVAWMEASDGRERTTAQLMLAEWLGRAWRFDEAEEVLSAAAFSFQEDDDAVLGVRDSLAHSYREAGRLDRAIPLYEETLAICERVLEADDPNRLVSRNNLANAYREAGRAEDAIPLLEETLAAWERILDADDPNALVSRNNLASAYQDAGHLDQAIPLFEIALGARERVLGASHPDTLVSRNNLANAYREAGRAEDAIPLLEETLAAWELLLGENHSKTLTSRNNLALAYGVAGRLDEAIPLFESTLAVRERVLGVDHPNTLTSRNNLALAYGTVGRLDEAISLLESALAAYERVLGADHPNTLVAHKNLDAYRAAARSDV